VKHYGPDSYDEWQGEETAAAVSACPMTRRTQSPRRSPPGCYACAGWSSW